MDIASVWKINKKTSTLHNTLGKIVLTDEYRTFHPKVTKYTFFSNAHNILQHRTQVRPQASLNKFKIEITSNIFFNHNGMKTRNQLKEKIWKFHKYVEINHVSDKWVK